MVTFIPCIQVVLEGEEDKEVKGEGHEVFDGEAPPVLEDGLPPVDFLVALSLAQFGHRSGKLADAIEHDIGSPLLELEPAHQEGDNPNDDHPNPEANHANPSVFRI